MAYAWDFSFLAQNAHNYGHGLAATLELGASALVAGFAFGLPVGMGRLSRWRGARFLSSCFVELFRNIPPLILLFWFFYAIPIVTGWRAPPFWAAFVALALYATAYSAEIYRAGIASVGRGQIEAAKAIGMGYGQTMRFVVLPQAIRRVVPALTNQSIELVKTTALASTIAYGELLYQAKLVADVEYRPIESYTVAAGIFVAVLVVLAFGSRRLERRMARAG